MGIVFFVSWVCNGSAEITFFFGVCNFYPKSRLTIAIWYRRLDVLFWQKTVVATITILCILYKICWFTTKFLDFFDQKNLSNEGKSCFAQYAMPSNMSLAPCVVVCLKLLPLWILVEANWKPIPKYFFFVVPDKSGNKFRTKFRE